MIDRPAPQADDAEHAVLAAMLMDRDAVISSVELLDDSMFYAERHRRVFRALVGLAERGQAIDPITLSEELTRRGELESSGGKGFIGSLVGAIPTAANVAYHAEIVRERSVRRRLIEISTTSIREAHESALDSGTLLDEAESRIFELSQHRGHRESTRLKELLWPAMQDIDSRAGKSITGVESGFADLDEMTAGFQKSDLIIVAARPSMGKTAFTMNIAQHAASIGVPTLVFSLEMSKQALVQRILASEARVDAQRMRRGTLEGNDFARLASAAGSLSPSPIWIDDTTSLGLLELRSKARRHKAEHQIGLVVIDYLQLMTGPADAENRQQEVSQISRGLKGLAKELEVPVIALSQLSRAPESRGGENRRPQLSDLRESGAIEQDADLIMFLYRQEFYDGAMDKDGNSIEGKAEVIIGKQRSGPTGIVELFFHKQYTRFESRSRRTP